MHLRLTATFLRGKSVPMRYTILVINPGSTSTKFGVFEGAVQLFADSVAHSSEEIARFPTIASQYEFRDQHIRGSLAKRGFDLKRVSAVIGRGGLLRPIPGGIYRVTEGLKKDLASATYGEHASNLGGLIAASLASQVGSLPIRSSWTSSPTWPESRATSCSNGSPSSMP